MKYVVCSRHGFFKFDLANYVAGISWTHDIEKADHLLLGDAIARKRRLMRVLNLPVTLKIVGK